MKKFIIDEMDFHDFKTQRYWSIPASYTEEKKKETINSLLFSGDYLGSKKVDGAFYRFVKDDVGRMELIGRSKGVKGDYIDKIEWVPHLHSFFESLPNGTCLIGELYFPDNEGSNHVTKITGCLQPKAVARQKENKLYYYVFDVLAFDGKILLEETFKTRTDLLRKMSSKYFTLYVEWAQYLSGQALYNELTRILEAGGEGIVITDSNSKYLPGKRKARQTLKIKKELEEPLDVVIIGTNPPTREYKGKYIEEWKYWENTKTNKKFNDLLYYEYTSGEPLEPITKAYYNNWAGSLVIGAYDTDKEEFVPIGSLSGLTEEILANAEEYIGEVAEISGMQIMDTDNQGIRHPVLKRWRKDKGLKECTLDSIFT